MSVAQLDHTLLELINQRWTSPLMDRLMPLMSSLEAWIPFIVLAVIAAALFGGKVWRRVLVGLAITLVVTEWGVGLPLKLCAGKLRPYDVSASVVRRDLAKAPVRFLAVFQEPRIKHGKVAPAGTRGSSFTSNHVLNLSGATAFLIFVFGRRALWLIIIPLLGAYSRIYCGSHWPTDMPHSLVFGILSAWAVWRYMNGWIRSGDEAIVGKMSRVFP
jgi:undecaprenyl-diphosphatase